MAGKILRWFSQIFRFSRKPPQGRPAVWPTREEIARLPVFKGLELESITVVDTPAAARRVRRELAGENILGFDTESKPTFRKGEVSTGPHVVQFSTARRAYIVLLHDRESRALAGDLLRAEKIKKAGFGLLDDLRHIRNNMGVEPQGIVELQTVFAKAGHEKGVGLKTGVAIALGRRLLKSKKIGTSNWAQRRLTDYQLLYAANDAYASLCVHQAMVARD